MDGTTPIERHVLDELAWEPSLKKDAIQVAVSEGTVTLTGSVESYAEKLAAERAAQRVEGVRRVSNQLSVQPPPGTTPDDRAIFEAARHALRWNILVPKERVQVGVRNGWVTLAGEVSWPFQRNAAEHTLRHLRGIRGIVDRIRIHPRVTAEYVEEKIEAAFRRAAGVDARGIRIEVDGTRVILRGQVTSWAEREEAEQVAWLAPGITDVENQLVVEPGVPLPARGEPVSGA